MYKIILWGTGKIANRLIRLIDDEIMLVVDNDERKWETTWNGYIVKSPYCLEEAIGSFDKIVIASKSWREIREQIIHDFKIDASMIENMYYRQKAALLTYYENEGQSDKQKYLSFLKNHPLDVFNDEFPEKYREMKPEVYFDPEKSLYYVYHNHKRMYFSSRFSDEEQVKEYYCSLLIEQDAASPHRYQTENFYVSQHDVVLDIGVAEGNFALDVIDLVDKLYLVEADKEWIKALKYTFESYKDKVEIIDAIIGDGNEKNIAIDFLAGNKKIDFIKMDIEGCESRALRGAKRTLEQNDVKLDICVYHNVNDEEEIKSLLEEFGYHTETSQGYMVFVTEQFWKKEVICPKLVKGLIRGRKRECERQ